MVTGMTQPPRPGYWLANDGKWYPPDLHPDRIRERLAKERTERASPAVAEPVAKEHAVAEDPVTIEHAAPDHSVDEPVVEDVVADEPAVHDVAVVVEPDRAPDLAAETPEREPEPLPEADPDSIETVEEVSQTEQVEQSPPAAEAVEDVTDDPVDKLDAPAIDEPDPAPDPDPEPAGTTSGSRWNRPTEAVEVDPAGPTPPKATGPTLAPVLSGEGTAANTPPMAPIEPVAETAHGESLAGVAMPTLSSQEPEGTDVLTQAPVEQPAPTEREPIPEPFPEASEDDFVEPETKGFFARWWKALAVMAIALVAANLLVYTVQQDDTDDGTEKIEVFSLGVGTCINQPNLDELAELKGSVERVDCADLHTHEVFHKVNHADGSFDTALISKDATAECAEQFETYTGRSYNDSPLLFILLLPNERAWDDGNRATVCALFGEEPMRGSARR